MALIVLIAAFIAAAAAAAIPSAPAADPRPGPTGMPRSFAWRIKSHTIRKYPANFIC